MTQITRRGIFGLAGGAAGLASCQVVGEPRGGGPVIGRVSFDHGVACGDPLADRVVIWTRITTEATGAVAATWRVFSDAGLSREVRVGTVVTSSNRDYTVKVDVEGLSSASEYFYQFTVNTDTGPVVSPVGRMKTLAASGTAPVRAAVISCTNFPFGYFHVYDAISKRDDLDVVIHLGDYIYEYGNDGYGGQVGAAIGRNHEPAEEITTLAAYRARHAQYKSEQPLQDAHAAAPWICTWDDHESANDSYRTGAQNHDPDTEGMWTDRKAQAVQAYLEWMPVRDPVPGAARAALWRRFDFGDLASVMCLETRLTGRSEGIDWSTELVDVAPENVQAKAGEVLGRVNDPARTMLGAEQEAWLDSELSASAGAGKHWQVLANQIIMAKVRAPNLTETLTREQIGALQGSPIAPLIGFSALGLSINLDAWDGYPAARERLYQGAKAAGANLVTLTGDTHTAWANSLVDKAGEARGVEFGCTSVTSPGLGTLMPGIDGLGQMFSEANEDVAWHDPHGNGFTVLELSADEARADFFKVSDVTKPGYTLERVSGFVTRREEAGVLRPV